jgi:hypothetical protein
MPNLKTLPATPLDWAPLIQQAQPYTALVANTDPVSGLVDLTYCGLKANLSDVLKQQPAGGLHSLAVFADTLVVDVQTINTAGLMLVVRNLDVSALAGQPLRISPAGAGSIAVQILVGGATGGSFTLGVAGVAGAPVTPPASSTALSATTYVASKGEPLSPLPPTTGNNLATLIGYSWTMNSLYAGFSAAASLMDQTGSALAQSTAQAMLAWVVACTANLGGSPQWPSDYAQLYNQAASLLVTLNVAPGAMYVPVLAQSYYSQHMSDIVSVIGSYEGQMQTLTTQQDIAQAIATVSASLQAVANDEVAPLQTQLAGISANIQSLYNDIIDLRSSFTLQTQRAHTAFEVLQEEITIDRITEQLSAELDLAMSVISLGFDAVKVYEGDSDGLKEAIKDSVEAIKGLVATIQAGESPDSDDLASQATELLQGQSALMQSVLQGRLLWQQAIDNATSGVLPTSLAAITIDPVTDWDNYIAGAEAAISSLERDIGSSAQNAADTYLATLKVLAGYGKAIGGKYVAYVAQLVQATVVIAQINAAQNVESRWQATVAQATSDAQKLAALKAVVQSRIQTVKRSLYLAWTNYADSYYYLNFQAPPRVISMDMDAAQLGAALVGVAEWVAQAVGNAPDGQHVRLPSSNAQIGLEFAILPAGAQATSGDVALLDQTADGGWSLTFSVPLGTSQLEGVLPNGGRCAIWISQAAFFLDGVTPNSKGNVIASVSTSGTYQNGIGAANAHTFVTKGLTGDYAYRTADGSVYSPWAIDTQVYMTPTPYTQWSIALAAGDGDPSTATRLRVALTVAYLSAAS